MAEDVGECIGVRKHESADRNVFCNEILTDSDPDLGSALGDNVFDQKIFTRLTEIQRLLCAGYDVPYRNIPAFCMVSLSVLPKNLGSFTFTGMGSTPNGRFSYEIMIP